MTKTLKDFLEAHHACDDGYEYAKDMTLKEFLENCERGDWILWLFIRTNPNSLKELTLAKGHCADTVRHLMKDQHSIDAVDAAIAFGEGKITRDELGNAARAAFAFATDDDDDAAAFATHAAYTAAAAHPAHAHAAAVAVDYNAAKEHNQKKTADICRKYLPLEIWNTENI